MITIEKKAKDEQVVQPEDYMIFKFKHVVVVCSSHVRNSILINLTLINPQLQGVRDHFCFRYDNARREFQLLKWQMVKCHFIELTLQLKE